MLNRSWGCMLETIGQIMAVEDGLHPVFLTTAPLTHAAGPVTMAGIAMGATIVVLPTFDADAVMAALRSPATCGKIYELGGPRVWTFREILAFILKQTRRNRKMVDIPLGIARIQASILQHVPGKPLTRDQLLLLGRDNVVTPGAKGLQDLGITATPIELVVPEYLDRYRPGGGKREEAPA